MIRNGRNIGEIGRRNGIRGEMGEIERSNERNRRETERRNRRETERRNRDQK